MRKFRFFITIILTILFSVSPVFAEQVTLNITHGQGTGNGTYLSNVTLNSYSDILGYTPKWTTSSPYDSSDNSGHTVFLSNGAPVYCIQPGILIKFGSSTYDTNYQYDAEKTAKLHSDDLAWISYFGYLSPAVNHSDVSYYDATQHLVWETIYPQLEIKWFTDINNKLNSDTNNVSGKAQEIENLIKEAKTLPNITAPSKVAIGEVVTFSGDYSNYDVKLSSSTDATIVSKNENGLSIKFNTTNPVTITATKKFVGSNNINSVVYTSSSSQDLISLGLNIPTVEKSITVTAKGANLSINKVSSESGSFLGDSSLGNAVYTVEYSGNSSYEKFELVTNENGLATTVGTKHDGKLPIGVYTIKEKTPSKGYELDKNVYTIEITKDNFETVQSVKSVEKLIQAKVQIVKVEASDKTGIMTPEVGKVFKLYPLFGDNQNAEVATFITDQDGFAISDNIPSGRYILKQVEPYGTSEPIKSFEIVIDSTNNGKTLKYVLANAPYSAKVMVIKKDYDSKDVIEKAGIKFKIKWLKDENGKEINEYITQTITLATGKKKKLEYFETDVDGIFITPISLKPGTYQLEEISTLEGYKENKEPYIFEILPTTEGIELDEEYGLLLKIDFYNKKEEIKEEEPEVESPDTGDNTLIVIAGLLVVVSTVGFISYKKIRN